MELETRMPTNNPQLSTPKDLFRALTQVWVSDTASPPDSLSPQSPAKNHCSVTSLIVQDYFGGEILSTKTSGGTHFYNRINGIKWDLTVSQFGEPEPYDDMLSSRVLALRDTSDHKYNLLTTRLKECAGKIRSTSYPDS
ncbi:YunG family protein [Solimicrobium silvestre]